MKTTRDVIFRARDLAAVKRYYNETIGLPIVMDKDHMVGFDTGSITMYFEVGEPSEPVFEFIINDLTRAKDELLSAGCSVVEENPSIPRVYMRDPFGVIFNISEPY